MLDVEGLLSYLQDVKVRTSLCFVSLVPNWRENASFSQMTACTGHRRLNVCMLMASPKSTTTLGIMQDCKLQMRVYGQMSCNELCWGECSVRSSLRYHLKKQAETPFYEECLPKAGVPLDTTGSQLCLPGLSNRAFPAIYTLSAEPA
jgi:hypothetical protein